MIKSDLLEILRCPLDPSRRLELEDDNLVCQRCRLRFKIKDDFPVLVAEEAILPPGYDSQEQLPCRQHRTDPAVDSHR